MSVRWAHAELPGGPLAAVVEGRVVPLADALGCSTVDDLIAAGAPAWGTAAGEARRLADQGVPLDEVRLGSPLRRPSKIACIGLNFHDHARESGQPLPERPLVFAKFPSTLIGTGEPISWPPGLTNQVDWEVELAVVVGHGLKMGSPEEAMAAIFGYTVANDVSARDLQFSDGQWLRGKSLDGFCPLGPTIVTPEELGDPGSLRLASRVNGETMQDSTTAEMVFAVGEILSFLSESFTLEPGDLVLTGTPWGVGAFRNPPVFLQPSDVVEVEVERIGILSNPIERT